MNPSSASIVPISPVTTPGRLLFEDAVPEEHRAHLEPGQPIETKAVKSILQHVADHSPDRYRKISADLLRLGNRGAIETDSSFGLEDLRAPVDVEAVRGQLRRDEDRVFARKDLDEKGRQNELIKLYHRLSNDMPEKVYQAAMGRGSNLARMVASGARGNKQQLNSNVGMDGLVVDSLGNPVPIPLDRSYAEGLSPAQYFAASYGTRQGLMSTKFCLSAGTEVLMADYSVRKIEDVEPGEWVMGADRTCHTFPVQVLHRFDNGLRDCFRYKYRMLSSRTDFAYLDCTPDHKVLSITRSWKTFYGRKQKLPIVDPTPLPAGQRGYSEVIACPVEGYIDQGGIPEHRAMLLGILLGDGCTSKSTRTAVLLSCNDPLLIEDTVDYFAQLNRKASKCCEEEGQHTWHLAYIVPPPKIVVSSTGPGERSKGYCGCPLYAWLRSMGITGKYAHEKSFPEQVWEWDNRAVADLIGGLFSTDGSVYPRTAKAKKGSYGVTITLTLTSEEMVKQTKRLLALKFGIISSKVYFIPKESKENATHDQYQISISHRRSVTKFYATIPLVGIKHREFPKLMEKLPPQSNMNSEHTFKRLQSEPLGQQPTFDLEVDHPDHLFVLANGLIVSNSVQDSGFLSKQLSSANQDLIVTSHDCGTKRGFPVEADDKDNVGSLLARPAAGHAAGTAITSKMLKDFRAHGLKRLVVRSPITCDQEQGLCAKCAGIRERGGLPPLGDSLGLAASSAVGEPLSQGLLSAKHSAGVANAGAGSRATGFKAVNQLVQIPKVFQGGATVAQHDGAVAKIEAAPQGGHYLWVDDGQPD